MDPQYLSAFLTSCPVNEFDDFFQRCPAVKIKDLNGFKIDPDWPEIPAKVYLRCLFALLAGKDTVIQVEGRAPLITPTEALTQGLQIFGYKPPLWPETSKALAEWYSLQKAAKDPLKATCGGNEVTLHNLTLQLRDPEIRLSVSRHSLQKYGINGHRWNDALFMDSGMTFLDENLFCMDCGVAFYGEGLTEAAVTNVHFKLSMSKGCPNLVKAKVSSNIIVNYSNASAYFFAAFGHALLVLEKTLLRNKHGSFEHIHHQAKAISEEPVVTVGKDPATSYQERQVEKFDAQNRKYANGELMDTDQAMGLKRKL